jgi:hypothetical protein
MRSLWALLSLVPAVYGLSGANEPSDIALAQEKGRNEADAFLRSIEEGERLQGTDEVLGDVMNVNQINRYNHDSYRFDPSVLGSDVGDPEKELLNSLSASDTAAMDMHEQLKKREGIEPDLDADKYLPQAPSDEPLYEELREWLVQSDPDSHPLVALENKAKDDERVTELRSKIGPVSPYYMHGGVDSVAIAKKALSSGDNIEGSEAAAIAEVAAAESRMYRDQSLQAKAAQYIYSNMHLRNRRQRAERERTSS